MTAAKVSGKRDRRDQARGRNELFNRLVCMRMKPLEFLPLAVI